MQSYYGIDDKSVKWITRTNITISKNNLEKRTPNIIIIWNSPSCLYLLARAALSRQLRRRCQWLRGLGRGLRVHSYHSINVHQLINYSHSRVVVFIRAAFRYCKVDRLSSEKRNRASRNHDLIKYTMEVIRCTSTPTRIGFLWQAVQHHFNCLRDYLK